MKFINPYALSSLCLTYLIVSASAHAFIPNASDVAHASSGNEMAQTPNINDPLNAQLDSQMTEQEILAATNEWENILAMLDAGSDQVAGPGGRGHGCSVSGMASYYGPGFHGRRTASGAKFNANGLTAAHRWLSFGTQVRVTSVGSGRAVTVRINDRGPFHGGRIIDLSAGAARVLGITTGLVRLQCI